jgi:hypothetical protein
MEANKLSISSMDPVIPTAEIFIQTLVDMPLKLIFCTPEFNHLCRLRMRWIRLDGGWIAPTSPACQLFNTMYRVTGSIPARAVVDESIPSSA